MAWYLSWIAIPDQTDVIMPIVFFFLELICQDYDGERSYLDEAFTGVIRSFCVK